MKNLIFIAIAAIFAAPAMAQPVSDRGVIPVAVTLNQVLRLNITSGGNIEFVFNTITQYKTGIANGGTSMYDTDFNVASSTSWELDMGAEDATFQGTDNPINTLDLDNVGFIITESGAHNFGTELVDVAGVVAGIALPVFPVIMIGSGVIPPTNAGDETDNDFTINWECGTTPAGGIASMNPFFLIDLDEAPDRYVTNVLLDLRSLP